MNKVELLKKLVLVVEDFQKLGLSSFQDVKIVINNNINLPGKTELVKYSFNVMEIPFNEFTSTFRSRYNRDFSNTKPVPYISIEHGVDLMIVFYVVSTLNLVYQDDLYVYLSYSELEENKNKIVISTLPWIAQPINKSRPISAKELLDLKLESMNWYKLKNQFPVIDDGRPPEYESSDYDHERDTFDAMTDGQYGDYYDWREAGGSWDSLRDRLGH